MPTDADPDRSQAIPGVRWLAGSPPGVEVECGSRVGLFARAAKAAVQTVYGAFSVDAIESRLVALEGPDTAGLLRAWLDQLLRWAEEDEFVFRAADVVISDAFVEGTVVGGRPPGDRTLDVRGVRAEDLEAGEADGTWRARFFFRA